MHEPRTPGPETASRPESRGAVKDARGRRVTMIDPIRMQMLHQYDVIDQPALEAILNDVRPGFSTWARYTYVRIIVGLAAGVVSATIAMAIVRLFVTTGQAGLFSMLAANPGVWAGVVAGVMVPIIIMIVRVRPRLPAVLLSHRRCLHCGYDLTGLPASDADGATVCPECACAWKLDEEPAPAVAGSRPNPALHVAGIAILSSILIGLLLVAFISLFAPGGPGWLAIALSAAGAIVAASALIWVIARQQGGAR